MNEVTRKNLWVDANKPDGDGETHGWVQYFDDPKSYVPVDDEGALDDPVPLNLAEPEGPLAIAAAVVDIEADAVIDTEIEQ